jgi:hypothetical protein
MSYRKEQGVNYHKTSGKTGPEGLKVNSPGVKPNVIKFKGK